MDPGTVSTLSVMLYILRFTKELDNSDEEDFLIVENLKEVNLQGIFENLSQESFGLLSEFKIKEYDLDRDELNLKGQGKCFHRRICFYKKGLRIKNPCCFCSKYYDEGRIVFKEIHIPVTMELFLKVNDFDLYNKDKLSVEDIYYIIRYLFLIMDNKIITAHVLLNHRIKNINLYQELEIVARSKLEEVPIFFYAAFSNILAIAEENFMLQFRDSANNVAQSYCENDILRKLPLHIGNVFELFFDYFKMEFEFLLENTEDIIRMISESNMNTTIKTLDVDFTGYIQTNNLLRITTNKLWKFKKMFKNTPLKRISRLVLKFSCVNLACNLRLSKVGKVDLYGDNVTFSKGFVLPKNLNKIVITNSMIKIDFVLPDTTRILNLKESILRYNAKIQINNDYSNINIENTHGDIRIPYISKYFKVEKGYNQLVINTNQENDVKEIVIEKATLKPNWPVRETFKQIHLKNVKLGEKRATINAFSEVLNLQMANDIINLGSMARTENSSSDVTNDYDSFHLKRNNDIWKLEMLNLSTKHSLAIKQQVEGNSFTPIQIRIDEFNTLHLNCLFLHLINFNGYLPLFGIQQTSNDTQNHNQGELILDKYEENGTFFQKMCKMSMLYVISSFQKT